MTMEMERRSTERLKCDDSAFTLVKTADAVHSVGRITDINLSGMGFRYITGMNASIKAFTVTVFSSKKPYIYINQLSCEVVYDYEIPDLSMDNVAVRHCGVKFVRLLPEQARRISLLLRELTANQV